MNTYQSYFRKEIDDLAGYTPGEQPKMPDLLKLNTNENCFAPSPKVGEALKSLDFELLRRYPDPDADKLCSLVAAKNQCDRNMVIAGNGSDDLLTMIFRAFTSPDKAMACLEPSYSLYPVLAAMQKANVIRIALNENDFSLPGDLLQQAQAANLLIITRPNAPTGNSFPLPEMKKIAEAFHGVVLFDEAYADFADDNCMELAKTLPNVIVSRTFSKSYSLAGIRMAYAVAHPAIIDGLRKLKDSYNTDRIAQEIACTAYSDESYMRENCHKIRSERQRLAQELTARGFRVIPSHANFLFAAPPDGDGKKAFEMLRSHAIIVRYFPGPVTGHYLRITVGTPAENDRLLTFLSGRKEK